MKLKKLTYRLFGPFSVLSETGEDMLPVGSKTRALVALLLTAENYERRRTWIQEKLWSDRGKEQRSASLRQALVELRKCWQNLPEILNSDRHVIALDPEYIVRDKDDERGTSLFLEDISVEDPAFKSWISLQRQQNSTHQVYSNPDIQEQSPIQDRAVTVICRSDYDVNAMALEQLAKDKLCRMFRECPGVSVRNSKTLNAEKGELLCSVKVIAITDAAPMLRITIETAAAFEMIFAGSATLPVEIAEADNSPAALQLFSQVVDSVTMCDALPKEMEDTLHGLTSRAIALMFSFEVDKVANAVLLLERALEMGPSGEVSAWLVQALNIQFVERLVVADEAFVERVEYHCRQALRVAPVNSTVLASVANARINFQKEFGSGHELAQQAVLINNANPLAWWALSNAELSIGRTQDALQSALKAQYLARLTRFEFWADFQVSLTLTVLGEYLKAKKVGARSSALSPSFRPPLRYLVGLNALVGDVESARHHAARLLREEPDFSVFKLTDDDSYPAGFLRRLSASVRDELKSVSADL